MKRAAEEGVISNTAPEPPVPAQVTPTTVAPPMPASQPPATASNVISTSPDQPEEPAAEGPPDGVGFQKTQIPEDESWQDEATEVTDSHDHLTLDPDADPAEHVDFDQYTADEPVTEPPPMKRVRVSNQLDILAELESLRVGSLSNGALSQSRSSSTEIDIDSLISGAMGGAKEIRRKVAQDLNSKVFNRMRGLEFAIQVKDAGGDTIHTLDPVVLEVDDAGELTKLSVRFVIDLDNTK